MDSSHNAGLQRAIDAMENVKGLADDAGIVISRADLWALAGKTGQNTTNIVAFHRVFFVKGHRPAVITG